ncbi:MAG: hypothetical protein BWX71_01487 [Deltaproteobacteria bacterium ADurb.Bin072]|nr:MAG: hypothetical protein BWX71_01487 [Deltaproteobacteria bacterium ADurb.Bin072]
MTPMSADPIWVASLMRWNSPEDSEPAERLRVRYPMPTELRNPRRSMISLTRRDAISSAFLSNLRPSKKPMRSSTLRVVSSKMFFDPIVTWRSSFLSRAPEHMGQVMVLRKREISSLMSPVSLSFIRLVRFGMTPSKGAEYWSFMGPPYRIVRFTSSGRSWKGASSSNRRFRAR